MPNPLYLNHLWEKHGCRLVDAGGWQIPGGFSSVDQEYRAARERCALFDNSARGKLRITGRDRAQVLHSLLTSDVRALRPGQGQLSAFLTAQAKVIADMVLYMFDDFILLDTEIGLQTKLAERLGRLIIMEDAVIEDVTGQYLHLSVRGPDAGKLIAAAGAALPEGNDFSHAGSSIAGHETEIVRRGAGCDLFFSVDHGLVIADELLETGIPLEILPAGYETWEILRIEEGRLRYGIDLSEEDTLPETGLDETAASETKGCYPGQEVVARTRTYKGHARKMTGLTAADGRKPLPGDKVFSGETEAGWITSSAFSPALQKHLMLSYIRKPFFGAREFTVQTRQGSIKAETAGLPFVEP